MIDNTKNSNDNRPPFLEIMSAYTTLRLIIAPTSPTKLLILICEAPFSSFHILFDLWPIYGHAEELTPFGEQVLRAPGSLQHQYVVQRIQSDFQPSKKTTQAV
jgi:hypothetical protein